MAEDKQFSFPNTFLYKRIAQFFLEIISKENDSWCVMFHGIFQSHTVNSFGASCYHTEAIGQIFL